MKKMVRRVVECFFGKKKEKIGYFYQDLPFSSTPFHFLSSEKVSNPPVTSNHRICRRKLTEEEKINKMPYYKQQDSC